MAKMNWTRVNKDNLSRTRGYEFADAVAPPSSDNYADVHEAFGGKVKESPKKNTIVRKKTPSTKEQCGKLNNRKSHNTSILEEKIEWIAQDILLTNPRKKETCRFLYQKLIARIKDLIGIER